MRLMQLTLALLLVGAFCASCGESGERQVRPIEMIYYVEAPPGTATFRVASIQASNADHRFDGVVFDAPHVFVLHNARQPLAATFEVVAGEIHVTLAQGQNPIRSRQRITPADGTVTIATHAKLPEPAVRGDEVRIEVTSETGATVGFDASVSDSEATHITNCFIGDPLNPQVVILPRCLTPATFFIEEAKDLVSAVFSQFDIRGQSVRARLFVNNTQKDSDSSSDTVIVSHDL